MKILAINAGSSSLKYKLFDWELQQTLAEGNVERVGLEAPFYIHKTPGKEIKVQDNMLSNHSSAIKIILSLLTDKDQGVLKEINEITAVGHRVVHGGQIFSKSVLVTPEIIAQIESLSEIAPLHNPANAMGIKATTALLPDTPQVVIFDTAFHQTMPAVGYSYAVPREWVDKYHVRRYGFHGTSHLYVSKRAAVMLGKQAKDCNLITMHIGNGASIAAIKGGKCVDTSMGFTPLEGAVMGTRSGDLDPAVPLYMQRKLGLTPEAVDSILNKQSGLLGITGRYTDRRDIEDNADSDPLCQLAIDMEGYRMKKYIGAYYAVLGRVDAIVFTAGAGENATILRQIALEGLENLGIVLDVDKNKNTRRKNGETEISAPESKVKVFMIPTDEERVFIEDVLGVLSGEFADHMTHPYTFCK